MAKIRNTSGDNRNLGIEHGTRLVLAGAVIEVKAEEVYGFTQQSIWEPADDAAKKAHKKAEDARSELLGEKPAVEQAPVMDEKES